VAKKNTNRFVGNVGKNKYFIIINGNNITIYLWNYYFKSGNNFICVNKKYSYGLGIGNDDSEHCYNKLATNFAFAGNIDGCTTDGNRDVPQPNVPVTNCCTLNVDNCLNT
jgi:hypothetical protein